MKIIGIIDLAKNIFYYYKNLALFNFIREELI